MSQKLTFIIVIVVAILVAAYFVFVRPVGEVAQSPSPSPSATSDETASWQTYRNEEWGFEFKYPGEYSYVVTSGTQGKINRPDGNSFFRLVLEQKEFDPNNIAAPWGDKVQATPVKVGDRTGYQYVISDIGAVLTTEVILSPQETLGIYVDLGMNGNTLTEGDKKLFDQILSTFKFADTDFTQDTANWLTYRNEEYGFEVKYPEGWSPDCTGQPCNSTSWIWLSSAKDRPEVQVAIEVRDLVAPVLTAEEYFKNESFSEVISMNWTKIDGNSAFGGLVKISRAEAGVFAERFLMIVKDSRLYQLEFIERQDGEELDLSKMSVLDQILSTFRFIPTP